MAVASGAAAIVETPEGFTLPNQTLTITRVGGQLRISRIVVPPATADVGAAKPATSAGAPREPRRIGVRAGPKPSQFAGSLASSGSDAYLVFVQKGQLLDVRLQRGRSEAVVHVVNAATEEPLAPRAKATFVVTGRAPVTGDYRIDVQRTSQGDAPLPYMLSVRVR
jgi:hypothetical protein